MNNEDPMSVRVGAFFITVGMAFFLFFVISDLTDNVDFDYFFIALILVFVGYLFRRNKTPKRPPSGRFEGLKKYWGSSRWGKKSGGDGGEKKG
ncbi:MAG: hypothetical protein LC099_04245 [Anaerolineales bacterium]|nr:hypothetical protein [Anaerolineales bacterium]